MLPAEMLGGMSLSKGEKCAFCCTGEPDDSGSVPGYFEPMDNKEDGDDGWDNPDKVKEFMSEMSPRNSDNPQAM